jgi:uncharacterized membrane protein
MYSRAKISDHPIHPALVAFPIVFYTSTVAALIAHAATGDPFWFRAALTTNIAGVVMAVVASIPGAIDLFAGIPHRSAARATGHLHASLQIAALALFTVSAVMLWNRWYARELIAGEVVIDGIAPLIVASLGLVATMIGGALGWKLVQTHHVGIEPNLRPRPRRDHSHDPVLPRGAIGRTASHVRPGLH